MQVRWLVWGAALYAACALQVGWLVELAEEQFVPRLPTAVLVWGLAGLRPSAGVWLAAGVGLLVDVLGLGRLGVHLAVYAVAAALTRGWWSERPSWWAVALTAGSLDVAAAVAERLPSQWQETPARPWSQVALQAAGQGCATACALTAALLLVWIVRRLVEPSGRGARLELSNQWRMLAE